MTDKPYKVIIEGENGAGNQVFEMETPEEMQEQFQKAQTHATAKIREQAQELASARERLAAMEQAIEPVAPANGNGFDRNHYFSLLYSDPLAAQDYALSHTIGMPLKDFMNEYQSTIRPGATIARQNAINAQFVQKHPELLQVSPEDDLHNSKIISELIKENGWSYETKNLDAAFALAKEGGKLKLPPVTIDNNEIVAPPPTTVTRPSAQANTSETEEVFLRTAPVEKVREYLEKKHAQAMSR